MGGCISWQYSMSTVWSSIMSSCPSEIEHREGVLQLSFASCAMFELSRTKRIKASEDVGGTNKCSMSHVGMRVIAQEPAAKVSRVEKAVLDRARAPTIFIIFMLTPSAPNVDYKSMLLVQKKMHYVFRIGGIVDISDSR